MGPWETVDPTACSGEATGEAGSAGDIKYDLRLPVLSATRITRVLISRQLGFSPVSAVPYCSVFSCQT